MVTQDAIAHGSGEAVNIAGSMRISFRRPNWSPRRPQTGAALVEATVWAAATRTGSEGRKRVDDNGEIDHRQDRRQRDDRTDP